MDPHVHTGTTPSSNVPHKFNSIYDTNRPGFGYSNSDLKNPYLTSEQLNARMVSPSINPANFQQQNPNQNPNPNQNQQQN